MSDTTMQALVLEATGQLPVFRTDYPRPVAGKGEALVRVHAAALNHRDVWIMHGKYPGIRTPIVLGSDGAGEVVAVGEGVAESHLGRRVVLNPSLFWGDNPAYQAPEYEILGLPRNGTFAEYVTVPAENLFDAPVHLTAAQAAALPLAGLTAWRALVTKGQVKAGNKVLVTGIGAGTAQFALQWALAHSARVWVTSSAQSKIEAAKRMGARGGALYTAPDWPDQLQTQADGFFDIIIDSAGGDGMGHLAKLLAMGGRLVFFGGTQGRWPQILPQHLFYKQASIMGTTMGTGQEFGRMLACVADQRIVPVLDEVFPLADGAAAFQKMDSGLQTGKLILQVRGEG